MQTIPRPEYPRPQMVRENWRNLNGEWQFCLDQGQSGRERGLHEAASLPGSILVPFCPESKLSGIGHTDFISCVWYKRNLTLPADWTKPGRKTLLHIGACDYATQVWVNGQSVGTHTGGYISFSFDITAALKPGENQMPSIPSAASIRAPRASGRPFGWKTYPKPTSPGSSIRRTLKAARSSSKPYAKTRTASRCAPRRAFRARPWAKRKPPSPDARRVWR